MYFLIRVLEESDEHATEQEFVCQNVLNLLRESLIVL